MWGQPNATIARLFGTSKCSAVIAKARKRGKTPKAIIATENGLDSLFKEGRLGLSRSVKLSEFSGGSVEFWTKPHKFLSVWK